MSIARYDEISGGPVAQQLSQQAHMGWMVENPAGAHNPAWSNAHLNPSPRCVKLMCGIKPSCCMKKKAIHPNGAVTYAPYTPAVVVGNDVYLSGQINIDIGDSIVAQTEGTLAKIDGLLADAGASKHDLVFVQVLLKSMDYYAPMNKVYESWLDGVAIKPARAAFAVDALPKDALVEIVCRAVKSD